MFLKRNCFPMLRGKVVPIKGMKTIDRKQWVARITTYLRVYGLIVHLKIESSNRSLVSSMFIHKKCSSRT